MLGTATSPYILSLRAKIETQSKITIANWGMDYAEKHILPIYLKYYPTDFRPQNAIITSRKWLEGEIKFPEVKDIILNSCHQAAREAEDCPAAQAAARALGQAAACIHTPTHSLGIAFYGSAAIAYDKYGLEQTSVFYDKIANDTVADMENALQQVVIENELNKS